jgi:hypothetical protein
VGDHTKGYLDRSTSRTRQLSIVLYLLGLQAAVRPPAPTLMDRSFVPGSRCNLLWHPGLVLLRYFLPSVQRMARREIVGIRAVNRLLVLLMLELVNGLQRLDLNQQQHCTLSHTYHGPLHAIGARYTPQKAADPWYDAAKNAIQPAQA